MLFTNNLKEAIKLTKPELNAINSITHIDEDIDIKLIEELDKYFIENKRNPSAYQVSFTDSNSVRMNVFTDGFRAANYIDYSALVTWRNTFYLRFAEAYTAIGEQGKRYISPESTFNLAVFLLNNPNFKPLEFKEVI